MRRSRLLNFAIFAMAIFTIFVLHLSGFVQASGGGGGGAGGTLLLAFGVGLLMILIALAAKIGEGRILSEKDTRRQLVPGRIYSVRWRGNGGIAVIEYENKQYLVTLKDLPVCEKFVCGDTGEFTPVT